MAAQFLAAMLRWRSAAIAYLCNRGSQCYAAISQYQRELIVRKTLEHKVYYGTGASCSRSTVTASMKFYM